VLTVESTVTEVLLEIARTHIPDRAAVAPGDVLVDDLGFESLDLALAVAELEARLEVDPFATDATIGAVRTVGDFIAVYQRAVSARPR
jgi:acyl carrier protein